MKNIELRLKNNKYTILKNGVESSTTFDYRFRTMAVNKFKFIAKNTPLPFKIMVDDKNGKEIVNQEVNKLDIIDTIK